MERPLGTMKHVALSLVNYLPDRLCRTSSQHDITSIVGAGICDVISRMIAWTSNRESTRCSVERDVAPVAAVMTRPTLSTTITSWTSLMSDDTHAVSTPLSPPLGERPTRTADISIAPSSRCVKLSWTTHERTAGGGSG